MKVEKKYYSIKEVSKMLGIKEHVIRHWDSIDPKTEKLRIENLSIRTKGGTRFFNKAHIKKLSNLNNILKDNGKRNYSLDLASKIISQTKINKNNIENINTSKNLVSSTNNDEFEDIKQITNNLKNLIKLK